MVGNANNFHVVSATAEQRGQGAVRLIGAAGELVVPRADGGVEALSPQCLIPGQEGDSSLTGVSVAHVGRGTGC